MTRGIVAALALVPLATSPSAGQDLTSTMVERLLEAARAVASVGRDAAIWPGYRPDTIPVLYVVRDRGSVLMNWPAALPEGYSPLDGVAGAGLRNDAARGAASTSVILEQRPTAQVSTDGSTNLLDLIALTAHEAFHAFEGTVRREGRRFALGENSFLVTRYPVFDAENEAGMALEGRLLAAALSASTDSTARALARRFLAQRIARHRRLDAELAEFETLAELYEGMAEYVGYKVSELATGAHRTPDIVRRLEALTASVTLSIRLRFYVTGPGMAYLLDRLAGDGWKAQLVENNWTLQEALAHAVGYYDAETALRHDAERQFAGDSITAAARAAVARLRALRRAQVDSLLEGASLLVEVAAQRLSRIGLCGIDPQNLLQVEPDVFLHTRWVRPCSGAALRAEFNAPVVEERASLTLRAAVSDPTPPTITAGGTPLPLADGQAVEGVVDLAVEHPAFTIRSARADIQREGRTIRVRPYPEE